MKAALVRSLILLLVPAVWLSTSDAAQAATDYSTPVSTTVFLDNFRPGYDVTCGVTGYYGVTDDATQSVHLSMRCDYGWLMTSVEDPVMSGTLSTNGCATSTSLSQIDENVTYRVAPGVSLGCQVTEVCINLTRDMPLLQDISWAACSALDLGPPPTLYASPSGTCQAAQIQRPVRVDGGAHYMVNGSNKWQMGERFETSFTPHAMAGDGRWRIYVVTRNTADSNWGTPGAIAAGGSVEWVPTVEVLTTKQITEWVGWEGGYSNNGPAPGTSNQPKSYYDKIQKYVVGIGLFRGFVGTNYNKIPDGTVSGDAGMVGVNDASRCAFYWGEKVATMSPGYANQTADDPLGPIDNPPPVSEDPPTDSDPDTGDSVAGGCGFDWSDPTTYASAGICGLLEAIKALSNSIIGILEWLGDFIGKLGDLLADLFVPDPDSWGFDGLLDQFQTRPPGSVVMGIGDGLASFRDAYNGAGCGTLADFSSSDIDATLTCTKVKSIPGYGALYGLVQIGLFALTGLAVFRMMAGKVGGDT